MRVTFRIDYGDRRTPALLCDIRSWLQLYSRAGWQIRETDLADEEEKQQGRLTLLAVSFDDPRDSDDFTYWRDVGRWKQCL